MKRSAALIVGALVAASALSACGDGNKSSSSNYCARIATYQAESNKLDSVFASDTPDPDAVKVAFTTIQKMVRDLQKNAPSEIKVDVATMGTAIDSVVSILGKYNYDFVALSTAPEFAQLQEDLAGADMQAASDRLSAYSEGTCGLPPNT